ncbi:sulfite exporter TauE/SafE family protein [Faecalibaculum rodentium]|uniref:sulfite exporter TauE/SafE family protein n=1 Tax=Faecalibaculum rodentium TaxID=1702221 RepID=UPI00272A5E2B|nr:sulfite exporter TauE/SafE family protein [Faecalibaculum rodentium]
MNWWIILAVTFFAGMGAGLGTGFAGMSAAAVISPMLITFLGMEPYTAVGVALASDVLASAVSAWTYGKNGNLDIRNALVMLAAVLVFTMTGSWVSSVVPGTQGDLDRSTRIRQSLIWGALIGFVCGFVGAGGGMMMLLVLTGFLGYSLKMAVGTSVFVMTFTALTGALSHFAIGGLPDWTILTLCVFFTLLWARIAAVFANKADPKTLNRAVGVVLVVLGIVILGFQFLA